MTKSSLESKIEEIIKEMYGKNFINTIPPSFVIDRLTSLFKKEVRKLVGSCKTTTFGYEEAGNKDTEGEIELIAKQEILDRIEEI